MSSLSLPVRVSIGLVLLCVPVALISLAWPRAVQGYRTAFAHPIIGMVTADTDLSIPLYATTANAFAHTPNDDADGLAWRAEFMDLAAAGSHRSDSIIRGLLLTSLAQSPVNPRSWTLLCELRQAESAMKGIACLRDAFRAGAFDWFVIERRLKLAATDWAFLDKPLRDEAVSLVKPMWHTDDWPSKMTLRFVLMRMLDSENGRQLILAGLDAEPHGIQDFVTWVVMVKLYGYGY